MLSRVWIEVRLIGDRKEPTFYVVTIMIRNSTIMCSIYVVPNTHEKLHCSRSLIKK